MSKISIIIPSRSERFLQNTVVDVLKNAAGDIEVIAVLDGHAHNVVLPPDPRVKTVIHPHPQGMRIAINSGVKAASGKYLMKSDGHCLFAPGFDEVLKADCEDNWVVIPRRYSLDAASWKIHRNRPVRDYHYLCFPDPHKDHDQGMHGVEWPERAAQHSDPKYDIDDNMSFQGSCWFMHKSWFTDFLEGMDENPVFAGWAQEPTEIGNKTWLGGGQVKVNKKTYYAHLHKGNAYGRGYLLDREGVITGHNFAAQYWMSNSWPKQIHNIDWLVEKFWPVPTWPEDRNLWVSPINVLRTI
ncbi:MAG: Uncharacterized protein G01um101416_621 [Microgenomates group bacterium Gr01-1014_16]|nr:MAG: Uncharacterized protein G01um101416_621 [Microgenomates group bacterium Gr01-1014_16]